MNTKRIVITGGPGTGKSSLINELKQRGHVCFDEISRQVTLEARAKGVEQLFLTEPLLFSELLLEGRLNQFKAAGEIKAEHVFLDRGLPDVLAYMDYVSLQYPSTFNEACKTHVYDHVFVLAPWQEIFTSDAERYENFEQAIAIHEHLLKTYNQFDYQLIDLPFGSIESRTDFILEVLNL
ncbi:putative ATPase [Flavobacteriaceae bacterium MAR_2010_105]|nr:putative ATPase [Flavobacteriaceae bacterium MAR_2010_105]